MKLEMLFIGAGIFGLVFVLFLGIYSEGINKYNPNIDTSTTFGKMSSSIAELSESSEDMRAKIKGGVVSDENAVDEMIAGGYKATKVNPFSVLAVASNATSTLMKETGYVSAPIISFLIFVLFVLTAFAVIYLIFRYKGW